MLERNRNSLGSRDIREDKPGPLRGGNDTTGSMLSSTAKIDLKRKDSRNTPILIDVLTKEKFETLDDFKQLVVAGRNSEMPPSIGFGSPRVEDRQLSLKAKEAQRSSSKQTGSRVVPEEIFSPGRVSLNSRKRLSESGDNSVSIAA